MFDFVPHPVTLLMILLLLINDHWLRIVHPTWLTGKLGDIAWLSFAPLMVAIPLLWIIPRRLPHREQWVAWIAFGGVGIWFGVAKTIPAF
ncbi:MAG TPA: hypothetical protein VHL11_07105, partial [Phototrophicaceae bacterium]|nr:hypothetical protein [Phototrophicaceae bacterium]